MGECSSNQHPGRVNETEQRGKLSRNKVTTKITVPELWVWDGLAELGKGTYVHLYSPVAGYRPPLRMGQEGHDLR